MVSLVLVTGASGFLGAHIVNELLLDGYSVRAVARSAKVPTLEARYASYGSRVEVVGVDDLIAGDFTAALKGVDALIHVASPLPGKMDAQGTIDGAVKGAVNVVGQAIAAGIKKVVFTSSTVALAHPGKPAEPQDRLITENDWSDVTEEEIIQHSADAFFVYSGSKALSEKALWKLADAHPDVDVTTINPPFLFGPFAPGYTINKGDVSAMSTDGFFYQLIATAAGGPVPAIPTSFFVDVREAARAHVLALRGPPASAVGRKRILVTGGALSWQQAVNHLHEARPALKDRLPLATRGPAPSTVVATMDTSRAKDVLGIAHFSGWEAVVEATVDDLVRVEASWSA